MICIVLQECADGNAETGTAWTVCKQFDGSASLASVLEWARTKNKTGRGRLLLTEEDKP